jgi:hypothetical protein
MIDLEPMWLALAKYQPYADVDGHGESWRRMCERRFEDDAYAAGAAVAKAAVSWLPAFAAIAAQHAEAGEEAKKQALIVKAKQAAATCMEAVAAFHSLEDDELKIADYWSSKVIDRIEREIKGRGNVPS